MRLHELRATLDQFIDPNTPAIEQFEIDRLSREWERLKPDTLPAYRDVIESRLALLAGGR